MKVSKEVKSFAKDFKESLESDKNLDFIIRYESGYITSKEELIEGFQRLLDTGLIWELQGMYQRRAMELMSAGEIIESY
jgi:hypothetical protein